MLAHRHPGANRVLSSRCEKTTLLVPLVAGLVGVTALIFGPLWVLPVLALAAWYLVERIAHSPTFIVVWIAVFSLLGDKMILSTGVGDGQGLLRLGPLTSIALVGAMLVSDENARRATVDTLRWGSPAVLLVAIGTALPVFGVMLDYPLRTVTAAIVPLATGASLVLGVLSARSGLHRDRVRYLMLLSVTTIAAAVGLVLFLFNRGVVLPGATAIDQWGIATAQAYGSTWLRGRVGGLYTSPNIFGTLGGLALVFVASSSLTPWRRAALVVPALAILFVTQSRGVILATVIAITVGAVFRERRRATIRPQAVITSALVAALVIVALTAAAAVFPQYVGALNERIVSAARILTEGIQADRNFAGRISFWQSAWQLLKERPLGTFGPPELTLGTAVDNDYLRFALQGGFLYSGAWILYLVWLITTGLRNDADRFVGIGAVFLAVTGLTQTSSSFVMVIGMFSLFVGMHIEGIRLRSIDSSAHSIQQEAGEL